METFLIKAAQLILALAILVIIHEFGHFLFARIFRIRVEKFYIFFNPLTSIFKWKPKKYYGFFGRRKELSGKEPRNKFWGDTEYGIGWLPLGGYCKIAGMIDESMDTEQMKQPPKEDEFRSKPAWQRLLVMIAGVLFNFLLAILIYVGIVFITGEKYVPLTEARMGMTFSGEARKIGFRNGDIPLSADGKPLDKPNEARLQMVQAKEVTVLRGTDTVSVAIPKDFIFRLDNEMKSDTATVDFMAYRIPTLFTQVMPGEGAAKAGLKEGDRLVEIDGMKDPSLDEFLTHLKGREGKTVDVKVIHKEGIDTVSARVHLNENAKMGVGIEVNPSVFFNIHEIKYNIFQSIPRGIEMGTTRLVEYVGSLKYIFTKEGAKSIGGFGAIGSIFPEKWDWLAFWNIAAFLSVVLAVMNILPIPALDGGHVFFLLCEVITRRKPSEKFMERAQMVGIFLLIALLIYANGMDIVRFFFK